jgi:oligoendopeptidase F
VELFPWIAMIDAFQHWLYLHPNHRREEREEQWLELDERFSPGEDWSGLQTERRSVWRRQLHIFQCPFYYIEYGIAQLGALQIWLKSKRDFRAAVENYLRGLSLGGSRPLPELFETAGAKFDFSAATVEPIMRAVGEELALR